MGNGRPTDQGLIKLQRQTLPVHHNSSQEKDINDGCDSFCVSRNRVYNQFMSIPILTTKLYIPPTRPELVLRPHLIERLNEGLSKNQGFGRKLTLISAPAGFGKTTLISEWLDNLRLDAAKESQVVNPKFKIEWPGSL